MGQLGDSPMSEGRTSQSKLFDDQSTTEAENARAVNTVLQAVAQDLIALQQGVIGQLSRDVARLQAEKTRLLTDIDKLQAYYQTLQSRQLEALSQQQIAQQQLWAKQLAQVLASHLQALMIQRLNQLASTPQASTAPAAGLPLTAVNGHSDHAQRLLASLDATFSTTFKALQQDLNSYQSSLSQQLNRMQGLEQQGEAILEALIDRLREQLQVEASRPPAAPPQPYYGNGYPRENGYAKEGHYAAPVANDGIAQTQPSYAPTVPPSPAYPAPSQQYEPPSARPIPLEAPGAPLPLPARSKKELSNFQLGLLLVLLSTAALSIHNVVVRIIGSGSWEPVAKVFTLHPARVLGLFDLGGFLQLNLGNSLLILWLRMLVVLPLMVPVAMFLYPPVWRDLKKFLSAPDRRPLFTVIGSGVFLFLSQVFIYMAIGKIGAGPAVTILFMYPIVTVPLAWFLFGDRPTRLRWIVMFTILLGVIFTALPGLTSTSGTVSGGGALTAIASGIAFAFYLVCMQLGFKKLHPIPVTLIQFSTIFVLSSVILTLPLNLGVQVDKPAGFLVGGIILGALTLVGYLTNNFGVRYMGAALASIVASSGPVVTALLAFVLINNPLLGMQLFGIFLVTLGVGALSFERMRSQRQAAVK
ncbi:MULTISPECIES: DMT family transporter [Cyanophyceae]|uniref:EamA family transporter n=1 Tax=Stenomitos frigidus AS-A4 TaxID=2933935 RepID=A0ABV0KFG9_9CYAN|nr:DMT family transporter [Phormidium sp. FACHB-592]